MNKVDDALSHWLILLTSMRSEIVGYDYLKDLYMDDKDFKEEWHNCVNGVTNKHQIHDSFLFFDNHLCIPWDFLREHIIIELHDGGLGWHIGHDKTIS